MILPVLLYLVGHVAGLVLTSFDIVVPVSGFLAFTLGTLATVAAAGIVGLNNLLLSTLITYRIFRINREVVAYLGPKSKSMYRAIITATLESGLLYSAFLVILLIVYVVPFATGTENPVVFVMQDICIRIWAPIGIVSTIIVVRVTLGISLDSVESAIISIRAASTIHEEVPVTDISRSANGLTQKGSDQLPSTLQCESPRYSENSE
uniref:Uncharacterized protein n=1 Tax=Moniliophthora roreri TaxID=221103 RepID=A0A0W0FDR4_MONRR